VEREVRDGVARIAALTCRWLEHVADDGSRARAGRAGAAHRPADPRPVAAGTLSYSKVRAITRVATPELEPRLLALADAAPAAELERIIGTAVPSSARWSGGSVSPTHRPTCAGPTDFDPRWWDGSYDHDLTVQIVNDRTGRRMALGRRGGAPGRLTRFRGSARPATVAGRSHRRELVCGPPDGPRPGQVPHGVSYQ
jgi:hypothetical protein